jgi:hypothetical protein
MTFFNYEVPLISRKLPVADVRVSSETWRLPEQLGYIFFLSSFYTRHDQVCLGWGVVAASIFAIAQFVSLSWFTQAMIASTLTGAGCLGMTWLARRYTKVEQLAWILYVWLMLMVVGTIVTDLSIWHGWSRVIIGLCPMWLGICGTGYLITGVGMRSRLILLCGGIHFLAIALILLTPSWQTLFTGVVISGSVMALAELQWDSNGVCNYKSLY